MAKSKKVVAVSEVVEAVVPEVVVEQVVVEQVVPSLLGALVGQVVDAKPDPMAEAMTKATVKTEKNQGVGQFIKGLIAEGLGNKEVLAIVHEQYGNTSTTYACVAWYRNKMKKSTVEVKNKVGLDFVKRFAAMSGATDEEAKGMEAEVLRQVA